MYTLLISGAAALVGFALGAVAVSWWAGIVPALLAFILAFLLLSRRTMAQVQGIFARATAMLQKAPPPFLMERLQEAQQRQDQRAFIKAQQAMLEQQREQRNEVREILKSALHLEKWQFLVRENVHTQLGTIDYQEGVEQLMMQQPTEARGNFEKARDNLQKAWHPRLSPLLRDWRSRALLAVVHHRLDEKDAALKVMEEAEAAGTQEPLYWGLRAWLLSSKPEEAMQLVGRGIAANASSEALKDMQARFTNKQSLNMEVFGDAWYQFFPDQIPQSKREEMARAAGLNVPSGPAAQTAANRPLPRKTWPHPRR